MSSNGSWTASATRVVVTPPVGLPMGGYADRLGDSVGTADDLEVNLLTLGRGGPAEIVWVSIDSLAITGPLRQSLVEAVSAVLGVEPGVILCCASHTHSAPAGWVGAIHPVLPAEVDPVLLDRLSEAVRQVELVQYPVSLHVAETTIDGVGSNRHQLDGPHDRSAAVLTVRHEHSGAVLAVMYDFACHPTVLGPDNLSWSADWVGGARRRIRDRLGDRLPVLFQQGSAGDVSPRFHRRARNLPEVDRLGMIVGDRVVAAALQPGVGIEPGTLRLDHTTVVLPGRDREVMPSTHPRRAIAHERLAASLREGERAGQALALAGSPTEWELPISRVWLGERVWLHLPVELFSSYGLELRSKDSRLRVVGYTDAYAGYLADADAFEKGEYEALSSFFDLPTGRRLVDVCGDYVATR